MNRPTAFIQINEEGLDDFFIMKHKYEKSLKLDKHILYSDFISNYVKLGEWVYSTQDKHNAVPFNILYIDDESYLIHAAPDQESLHEFMCTLKSIEYDLDNLVELKPEEFSWDMKKANFFTHGNKMLKLP